MAEEEIKIAKNLYLHGQIEQAIETILGGLKVHPENIVLQDLLEQYRSDAYKNVADDIQQENEEQKPFEVHDKRELDQTTSKYKTPEHTEEIKNNKEIAILSFQMRLKALIMELNAVKTYFLKELIENENDTKIKMHSIETCISRVHTALDLNNFEKCNAQNELLIAESASADLMRKIKQVVKKDVKKEEVKEPEEDIEVPDYRSIVTVRGTKGDVTNCILKAKTALGDGKYDRAESLLLKAERICPTKNARNLLKQVRAAKEAKDNPNSIEIATEAVEQLDTIKDEESKPEDDSVSVVKCLTAFEKAFNAGKFDKAERMLKKAKRLDPELDIENKLSQVTAAINNKIMEEKRIEQIKKVERELKMAEEYFYKSIKAFDSGDSKNAEKYLQLAKSFDPMLKSEQELSALKTKMASESSTKIKDTDKTRLEETINEIDMEYAAKCLYIAKKAYDGGDFKKAQRYFECAKEYDPSLGLELYLSKCRAEIATRSSTEGNTVIPKKVNEPAAIKTKKELCMYYLEQAEIAYKNRNLNDTENFLSLAKSYHPCTKVNEMLERVAKLRKKYQSKSDIEITNSETESLSLEDKKHKELKLQNEKQRKEVIEKEKAQIRKNDQLEMNKTFEDQKNSLANNNKDTKNKQTKNDADKCKSSKNFEKEKPNTVLSPEKEEVKTLISMAKKAIYKEKFEDAMNVLNSAEELYPTKQTQELLKNLKEIIFSRKETVQANCYDLPVEANESDDIEVTKCIKTALAAFRENRYDRAEHFLHKSLRICDNQMAKSFLETVLNAKAQYNTKVIVETENNYNKSVTNQFLEEYKKCIDLTEKAIVEGNLAVAERFLSKAIQINPNDNDRKQLKHIEDVRALQRSSDEATTSKTVNSGGDLRREVNAEMFINDAVDAVVRNMIHVARHYFKWALQEQPNEETRKLLQNLEILIDNRNEGRSRSKNDIIIEANKLLSKAEELIGIGDLEKAESFLVISWHMCKSQRTTQVHKKFLEARMALFERHKDDAISYGTSQNIFESDKLVKAALKKYEKNKFENAEELLRTAATFYPSTPINILLAEIREHKNKGDGLLKKIFNFAVEKLS